MADELHKMGIRLMVSMWPTINEKSENYQTMLDNNMLIRTVSGSNRVFDFYGPQAEIDPTNPETVSYTHLVAAQAEIDLLPVRGGFFSEMDKQIRHCCLPLSSSRAAVRREHNI